MLRPLALLPSILLLLLATGCTAGSSYTIVEGHMKPSHFQFVDIVKQQEAGAGGWRAACVHLHLKHAGGPLYICKFGVEMPMETGDGPLSVPLAQRTAADCANLAATTALGATTPATPLGLACESFKAAFKATLGRAVEGSRVMTLCHKATRPEAAP